MTNSKPHINGRGEQWWYMAHLIFFAHIGGSTNETGPHTCTSPSIRIRVLFVIRQNPKSFHETKIKRPPNGLSGAPTMMKKSPSSIDNLPSSWRHSKDQLASLMFGANHTPKPHLSQPFYRDQENMTMNIKFTPHPETRPEKSSSSLHYSPTSPLKIWRRACWF